MKRLALALGAVLWLSARPADAHPVPFSYVDVRLEGSTINLTLVVHDFDLAHDLGLDVPDRLLDPAALDKYAAAIVKLLEPRLTVAADGRVLTGQAWTAPEALPDRASVRLQRRYDVGGVPGALTVTARMFPYDTAHQTFVNVYEQGEISAQAILDGGQTQIRIPVRDTAGRLGGRAKVRAFGNPPHPDRARSHPVPRRAAARRRVDAPAPAGRDVVYGGPQHHAVACGPRDPEPASPAGRARNCLEHRLRWGG